MLLSDVVVSLNGIGPKRGQALLSLGIESVGDLLYHMPLRYEDRRLQTPIGSLRAQKTAVVRGLIERVAVRRARGRNLYIADVRVADASGSIRVTLFGNARSFAALRGGHEMILYGEPSEREGSLAFTSPDYTVLSAKGLPLPPEWCRILPVYPTAAGLSRKWLANTIYQCITSPSLIVHDDLPSAIRQKHTFPALHDALKGIHAPESRDDIRVSRRRLVYQEFFDAQRNILAVRQQSEKASSLDLSCGQSALLAFLEGLPFALTRTQRQALDEISADMGGTGPMHRLLQGDVGSGKTLVALGAVVQCVAANCQAAVLVPTTVLSRQFFGECTRFLAPMNVNCMELTGHMTQKAKNALLRDLKDGRVDVLIGTHAMLEDPVEFNMLGLVVIDEQHRFGVAQRDRMSRFGVHPHVLMMSATPIPRTLCMAMYGDIDVSVISEKPACRKPVLTKIVGDSHMDELCAFLRQRIAAGERCYWVCPLIGENGENADDLSVMRRTGELERALPGVGIERLHGRMSAEEKSDAVRRFTEGDSNLVVSTTVIEVGVNIPEASVIVIESAGSFGLSQLHQLRGRVGRGDKRGICILVDAARNIKGNRRFEIMKNSDDGFFIAEEDLKIRGSGELGGLRQHGMTGFNVADPLRDFQLLQDARDNVAQIFQRRYTPSYDDTLRGEVNGR